MTYQGIDTAATINKAVAWALAMAGDSAHGYDQANRWGPNYDCSSFVISAWEAAGVPVRQKGASYTGNMLGAFLACGFRNVTAQVNLRTGAGLQKGDVLLNVKNHTEMYIGDGKVVKASINECGGVTGGQSGDQTGREIYVGSYYNFPWDCVLRYEGSGGEDKDVPTTEPETPAEDDGEVVTVAVSLPVLAKGDTGEAVKAMQAVLIARGFSCGWWGADGEFGDGTDKAVRKFQERNGLEVDGIVGRETWQKLLGVRA